MWSLIVVVLDELLDTVAQLVHRLSGIEIDVFLLDGAPEPLYPDVVLAASSAVHADLYSITSQQVLPFLCCVL